MSRPNLFKIAPVAIVSGAGFGAVVQGTTACVFHAPRVAELIGAIVAVMVATTVIRDAVGLQGSQR